MHYTWHIIIGGLICAAFVWMMKHFFGWYEQQALIAAIVIIISVLIPDIDCKKGILYKPYFHWTILFTLPILVILCKIYEKEGPLGIFSLSVIFLLIIEIILGIVINNLKFKHRGHCHSLAFCMIFALVIGNLAYFQLQMIFLAFIGSYSHLVLDGLWDKWW